MAEYINQVSFQLKLSCNRTEVQLFGSEEPTFQIFTPKFLEEVLISIIRAETNLSMS
jgi:hypothetical protein